MKASTDMIKITESIGDRVGGYYFSPTLIASRSTRKQCPLHSANPIGQSESPSFDRAGNDPCIIDWSPHLLRVRHHKPIDSARVDKGQSSLRGRVRCQSLFIAWERRRCEPDSKPVSDTASLTRCEGQVLGIGALVRTRKIFAGCLAIRPIWDQSPGIRNPRFETVGNRLYPLQRSKLPLPPSGRGANPRPFTLKDRTKYRPGLFTRLQHPLSLDGRGLG